MAVKLYDIPTIAALHARHAKIMKALEALPKGHDNYRWGTLQIYDFNRDLGDDRRGALALAVVEDIPANELRMFLEKQRIDIEGNLKKMGVDVET